MSPLSNLRTDEYGGSLKTESVPCPNNKACSRYGTCAQARVHCWLSYPPEEFEPGALKLGDDLVLMQVRCLESTILVFHCASTIRPRLLVMLCQIYESLTLLSRRLVIYLLLYRVILGHSLRLNGLPVTCLPSGQSSLKQPNWLGQMRNPGIQPESTVTGTVIPYTTLNL